MPLSPNQGKQTNHAKLSLFLLCLFIVLVAAFIIIEMPYLMDASGVVIMAICMLVYCNQLVAFYQPQR